MAMRLHGRIKRSSWIAQRARYLVKCVQLLVHVLRVRPLRQRIALAFLLAVPILFFFRTRHHRQHLFPSQSHPPSSANKSQRPGSYVNNGHPTLPEGAPEGDSALTERDIRTYPQQDPLRLEDAPPNDSVSIAYFIQIGPDSIALVPRLLRAIHDAVNTYIVHVDAKVNVEKRAIVADFIRNDPKLRLNVHILRAEMVTYKGVSMVMNTLAGMAMALRISDKWHYFINLSGSDYPLVSARNQRALLARPGVGLGRLNFMTFFPTSQWRPFAFRIRFMHWDPAVAGAQQSNARLRIFRPLREDPLEKYRHFTFTKAEAWMILSRPFVRFLTRSAFAKRMLIAHLHTRSAPEHYFADVIWNHPAWKKTLVSDALRKVVWYHHGRRSGQHPYVLDAPSWGDIWGFWDDIANTRSLFARKFSHVDAPLMLRIDRRLSGFGFNTTQNEEGKSRRAFFGRLCNHFDEMTKQTLKNQNVQWPASAYPTPRFFDTT